MIEGGDGHTKYDHLPTQSDHDSALTATPIATVIPTSPPIPTNPNYLLRTAYYDIPHAEGAFETIDCVIIGGTYSESSAKGRNGLLTRFTVAIADVTGGFYPPAPGRSRGMPKVCKAMGDDGILHRCEKRYSSRPLARLLRPSPLTHIKYVCSLPPPCPLQRWMPLAGVGSGMSTDKLLEINEKLAPKWIVMNPGTPTPSYVCPWAIKSKVSDIFQN